MCTEALTGADKINGVTREAISTVNKAPLTTRGNNLLLQFNSLLRNARPSSGRCLYTESKAGFMKDLCFQFEILRPVLSSPDYSKLLQVCHMTSRNQIFDGLSLYLIFLLFAVCGQPVVKHIFRCGGLVFRHVLNSQPYCEHLTRLFNQIHSSKLFGQSRNFLGLGTQTTDY